MTTSTNAPLAAQDPLDVAAVVSFAAGGTTTVQTRAVGREAVEVSASAPDGRPLVRLEFALGAATAYWNADQGGHRTLPPDWAASGSTSLIRSAPVGVLYDAAGRALVGWAADELVAELTVVSGASEEHKTFVVQVQPSHPLAGPLVIRVDGAGGSLADVVGRLGRWTSDQLPDPVLAVPPLAEQPVYSTWYTFTQDVDTAVVESEAVLAAELGCGSVFIDDGWQQLAHGRGYSGCGDWVPDPAKFANLRATVERIRGLGAGVALWIAPLLLGGRSDAFAQLSPFAPYVAERLECSILDPRFAQVREWVAATCVRLVEELGADALKIDFLDNAMVYRGTETGGDIPDVGEAMAELLAGLRRELAAVGRPDVAFEFRQPYVSPAMARYGQILRAGDCPADAVVNLRETVDCRLLSVGQVVHADPMMWGPSGGPEAVAQQLYGGWFAVPQISMRLAELADEQSVALRGLLELWRSGAEVALHGPLEVVGAERGYTQVRAVRPELGRAVIGAYGGGVVVLDAAVSETTILNATGDADLVISSTRPIRDGVVRDASARSVGTVAAVGPGLHQLEVPAYGSVTLTCSAS